MLCVSKMETTRVSMRPLKANKIDSTVGIKYATLFVLIHKRYRIILI